MNRKKFCFLFLFGGGFAGAREGRGFMYGRVTTLAITKFNVHGMPMRGLRLVTVPGE